MKRDGDARSRSAEPVTKSTVKVYIQRTLPSCSSLPESPSSISFIEGSFGFSIAKERDAREKPVLKSLREKEKVIARCHEDRADPARLSFFLPCMRLICKA